MDILEKNGFAPYFVSETLDKHWDVVKMLGLKGVMSNAHHMRHSHSYINSSDDNHWPIDKELRRHNWLH